MKTSQMQLQTARGVLGQVATVPCCCGQRTYRTAMHNRLADDASQVGDSIIERDAARGVTQFKPC
jgi:hypothetical protein